ncbi:MAG TPA: hypothetical protein VFJ19_02565 [Nocardioidaceae bacterium]|nr:hypothetical protein [Nocardioidaceae bacterium]
MTGLDHALLGLRHAVEAPRRNQMWRWLVRHRIAGVKDALSSQRPSGSGGRDSREIAVMGLTAREGTLFRERDALMARLGEVGPQVLDAPDLEQVHHDMQRLMVDLEHYRQRTNDLLYDAVSWELGGSE